MGRNVSYHPVEGDVQDGQTPIGRDLSTGSPLWRTYTKFKGMFLTDPQGIEFNNQPAVLTELFGNPNTRLSEDLTYCTQFRLLTQVTTVGLAGSNLGIQYSLDGGTNWFGLDNGTADVISTVVNLLTSTGHIISGWTDIDSLGRVDVLLRIVGLDGNGVVDPAFTRIEVQFR